MSKVSSLQKIMLILLILTVVLNIVAFFILPERVSLQINTRWDIHGNTVPKLLFLSIGPIVAAGSYLYAKYSSDGEKQAIFLSIIAFVGSGITILFNMIGR